VASGVRRREESCKWDSSGRGTTRPSELVGEGSLVGPSWGMVEWRIAWRKGARENLSMGGHGGSTLGYFVERR
jgi:hypothetical protein